LESDRRQLIGFFREHLNPAFDEPRFDWMYLRNPYGRASAWLLFDNENKRLIGAAAAFPRRLRAKGKEASGYVLGDFCIHPLARTLGPALQLQRACLDGITAGSEGAWYDFPSDSMTAIYSRLGKAPQTKFVRWAKPLRVDRALASKVKGKTLRGALRAVANLVLRTNDSVRRGAHKLEIRGQKGPCGDEFTRLGAEAEKPHEICVVNTAEYLNWRFLAHPSQGFDILTARNGSVLAGYLILAQEGDDARIAGLRSRDEDSARALCGAASDAMRSAGAMTLSASLVEGDARAEVLKKLGFRPREGRSVIFQGPAKSEAQSGNGGKMHWHLMDGDRDA